MTDQPLTPDELAAIEKRAADATAGPWRTVCPYRDESSYARIFADSTYLGSVGNSDMAPEQIKANAELAAHARTDVPRLLADVKRLRAALRVSHLAVCTADNCVLDGGTEHEEAFSGSDA